MITYELICGNCGAKNIRKYLPQTFQCNQCEEQGPVDEYYQIDPPLNLCEFAENFRNTEGWFVPRYGKFKGQEICLDWDSPCTKCRDIRTSQDCAALRREHE